MLAHVKNIIEKVFVWYVNCGKIVDNDRVVEVEGGQIHKNIGSGQFLHYFGPGLPWEPGSSFHLSDRFLSHLFGDFFCLNLDKLH